MKMTRFMWKVLGDDALRNLQERWLKEDLCVGVADNFVGGGLWHQAGEVCGTYVVSTFARGSQCGMEKDNVRPSPDGRQAISPCKLGKHVGSL